MNKCRHCGCKITKKDIEESASHNLFINNKIALECPICGEIVVIKLNDKDRKN